MTYLRTLSDCKSQIRQLEKKLSDASARAAGLEAELKRNQHEARMVIREKQEIINSLDGPTEIPQPKVETIIAAVCSHFGISLGEFMTKRRHHSIVWPRQVAMYLACELLPSRSFPFIAKHMGGWDHTTVIHSVKKIRARLTMIDDLPREIEQLKRAINGVIDDSRRP